MGLALRLMLAVMLIVGTVSSTPAVAAAMPCAGAMTAHHHNPAPGSSNTSGDKAAHCLTLACACCSMVQPIATHLATASEHATIMVWSVTLADGISGQRAKVATPPPRV